jgi:hypothetical protein
MVQRSIIVDDVISIEVGTEEDDYPKLNYYENLHA